VGSIGLAIGNEKTDTVDIAMPTSTSLSASPGVVYPRCLRSNGCISVKLFWPMQLAFACTILILHKLFPFVIIFFYFILICCRVALNEK
jgi:hypothetical protein